MLLVYVIITEDRHPPFHLLLQENDGMDKVAKIDYIRRIFHAMILPIEQMPSVIIKAEDLKELPEGFSSAAVLEGKVIGQIQYSRVCEKKVLDPRRWFLWTIYFWRVWVRKG